MAKMRLKTGWHKERMLHVSVFASAFSGAEVIVPLFQSDLPRGMFAIVSFVVVMAAGIFHALEHDHDSAG